MKGLFTQLGRAANNCTTCFDGFKHKSENISSHRIILCKKILGFELGAAPQAQLRGFFARYHSSYRVTVV